MITDTVEIQEKLEGYGWSYVFGEEEPSCPTDSVEAHGDCSTEKPSREDVVQILSIRKGTKDEESWEGVFLLKDGRYLYANGSCDYTGFD